MNIRHRATTFAAVTLATAAISTAACESRPSPRPADTTTGQHADHRAGSATVKIAGDTYTFDHGACSPRLDPEQFLYRSPAEPGIDPTYLAVTVDTATDNTEQTVTGSVTLQQNGTIELSIADVKLTIDDGFTGGRFEGHDYITNAPVSGTFVC